MRYGTLVPLASRTSLEKAIVHVGGCTATLVRPDWVLTAKHCTGDAYGYPEGRDVSHDNGQSRTVPTADVYWHPDPDVDAALLKLSSPIDAGQPASVPFYEKSADADIEGKAVTLYGYGCYDFIGGGCSNGNSCPTTGGWVCDRGSCCLPNTSGDALRKAQMTVGEVRRLFNAYHAKYLDLPTNASGQHLTPGDSGGPTFMDGKIVSLNGGVGVVAYARSWRDWASSVIQPASSNSFAANTTVSSNFGFRSTAKFTGDFNGDGYADMVEFVAEALQGDGRGDVYVSLNNGAAGGYAAPAKWHDWFCINQERPGVGDFDGDGRDDIVTFDQSTGAVWVAFSTGNGFGPGQRWHTGFSFPGETPRVGDMNGDGMADIITFVHYQNWGAVWVSLACGTNPDALPEGCTGTNQFGSTRLNWANGFSLLNEIPQVGDVNGDGMADLITFSRTTGQVWVALTSKPACTANRDETTQACPAGATCCPVYESCWTGPGFCPGCVGKSPALAKTLWGSGMPTVTSDWPMIADMDGDGKADVVNFELRYANDGHNGHVHVMRSTGAGFLPYEQWSTGSCWYYLTPDVGDYNRDGRKDAFCYEGPSGGRVFVGASTPSYEPCVPAKTATGGQSGSFNTTGSYCFRTAESISGWNCSSFDGRTLKVNGVAKTCGQTPLPAKYNGYYYFDVSAGQYSWASMAWWP